MTADGRRAALALHTLNTISPSNKHIKMMICLEMRPTGGVEAVRNLKRPGHEGHSAIRVGAGVGAALASQFTRGLYSSIVAWLKYKVLLRFLLHVLTEPCSFLRPVSS